MPSTDDVKDASGVGNLNALPAGAVGEELSRPDTGPAKALATYLDKPTDERLGWLTKAVMTARGMDTGGWRRHAGAVREAAEEWTSLEDGEEIL